MKAGGMEGRGVVNRVGGAIVGGVADVGHKNGVQTFCCKVEIEKQ